jgi:hypothetical protein
MEKYLIVKTEFVRRENGVLHPVYDIISDFPESYYKSGKHLKNGLSRVNVKTLKLDIEKGWATLRGV